MGSDARYEFSEIADMGEFDRLRGIWNDLLRESTCDIPFLRHEWIANWWQHFGNGHRPAIVVGWKGGSLAFAAPLMEQRSSLLGAPFVILRSMTNFHSFRFHLLTRHGDAGALEAFWQYLKLRDRAWNLLLLEEVPADIGGHEELVAFARNDSFHAEIWTGYESPYVPVDRKWDEYFSGLKAKFRSNLRNREKRLRGQGEVLCETVGGNGDLAGALEAAFEIERKGWKGKEGTAIACDQLLVDFYRRWAQIAAKEGWLRLTFLKVNGRGVAFDYSVLYRNRMYCMKIGYAPEYKPYSVGQLLCREMMRSCFESGVREYDFLGESSVQKLDWAPTRRGHLWIFVYSRHWLSRIHHAFRWRLRNILIPLRKIGAQVGREVPRIDV